MDEIIFTWGIDGDDLAASSWALLGLAANEHGWIGEVIVSVIFGRV